MINKTFRLFISSTFSDFVEERTILNNDIFPEIDAYCQEQGYNFQLIDLRWGVNNESALNQNTIAICLDEVRRCKSLSPKPNFLIMTGERYGWIPLPSHIKKGDFESLLSYAGSEDNRVLRDWYIYDENEIGGDYFLKTRSGQYTDDAVWSQIESKLRSILLECAGKGHFSEDKIRLLTSSATEQEIIEGLLGNDDVCNNAIALFRTGYPEQDKDLTSINNLKSRIIERMTQDQCENNIITLQFNDEYKKQFSASVIEILKRNIGKEIERLENVKQSEDIMTLPVYENNGASFFHAREDELDTLISYTNDKTNTPLFIVGESGSGKTTLLFEYINRMPQKKMFWSFFGVDEDSYTLLDSLKRICSEIKRSFDITAPMEMSYANISEVLYLTIYSIPKDQETVIILDGLDMFYDIESIHESVFPSGLPSNVKFIVSGADREIVDRFLDKKFNVLSIERFSESESIDSFNSLMTERNRALNNKNQMDLLRPSFAQGLIPLHVKLLMEVCSGWHSIDVIEEFPQTVEEVALIYLSNMYTKYGHNKELFAYALALVSVSPYGITEEELQELLLSFPSVKQYFQSEDRYAYGLTKLPFVVWSRLFYDLKGCLTLTRSNGSIVVKFVHHIFYRVFTKNFSSYCDEARKTLIQYYSSQSNYTNDIGVPNARKAISLGALLKRTGEYGSLCDLYSSLSFVDAAIKIGHVDEVISDLQLLLTRQESIEHSEQLKKILECVVFNRDMLNCYFNTFYSCAYEAGLADDGAPIIHRQIRYNPGKYIYFPYGSESRVSWYKDQDRYAVFNGSYVHICSFKDQSELCRIYIEPSRVDKEVFVRNVFWFNQNAVVVITYNGKMLIYDIEDFSPNVVAQYTCANDCVRVDYENSVLMYISGKKLRAINPINGEEKYSIPLKHQASTIYDFDERYNQIIIRDVSSKIDVYNAANGELIKSVKNPNGWRCYELAETISGGHVHQISTSKWLIYTDAWSKLKVVENDTKQVSFLHPPLITFQCKLIFGRVKLVIQSKSNLVSLDLNTYEIQYKHIDECQSIAWKSVDESISVVQPNGLTIVELNDFSKAETGRNICMIHKRNLFYSPFIFWKEIYRQIAYSLKPVSKMMKGFERVFDYDVLFSDGLTDREMELISPDKEKKGTQVVYSNSGVYAVAYEEENVITLYGEDDRPFLHIDNLNLSLTNGILKMIFSPDSKYFLIWRNYSIQVVGIPSGRKVVDINIMFRPAFDVTFNEDSDGLDIALMDGEMYPYRFGKKGKKDKHKLPSKLIDSCFNGDYLGPYSVFFSEGEARTRTYLDTFDPGTSPRKWLNAIRNYYTGSNWLWYIDGEFYLNDSKFSRKGYDFEKSREIEYLRDPTPLRSFLREKNDLFSRALESDSGRYIVLLSQMLNSIIVFDAERMEVYDAYKHLGNIIGYRFTDDDVLEIVSDREPYRVKIQINLLSD